MQIVLRWERTRWLAEAGESESPCQRTGRYRFVRGLHLGTSDHRRTRGRSARSDRGAPQPGLRPLLGCATIWFKSTLATERSCLVSSDSTSRNTGLRRDRRETGKIRLRTGRVAEE